jgi:protease I
MTVPVRIALLLEDGYEDSEAMVPYYRLQEPGWTVDLVAPEAGQVYRGKNGTTLKSTHAARSVRAADYDGVVIPGGHAPDRMRRFPEMVTLVREANSQGKPIAAICHAAQLMVEADILRGRTLTCFSSVKTDVKNAGGTFVDRAVVVDSNLVTSRVPADLPAFLSELVKVIGARVAAPVATPAART